MECNISTLQSYGEMTSKFRKILTSDVSLDYIGTLLFESWELKKKLASSISDPFFDNIYDNV